MSSRSKKTLSDSLKYSASGYFSYIFSFITGIVTRRVLGPALMGVFSELMLIFQYMKFYDFGILNSLDKEIPYWNGRDETDKSKWIQDLGFSVNFYLSVIAGIALVLFSLFVVSTDVVFIMSLRLLAVLVVIQALASFYTVIIRTHHKFNILSIYVILVAVLELILIVFLGIRYNFYGVLAAYFLTTLGGLFYLFQASAKRFHIYIRLPWKEIARLFRIGFPLFLSGLIFLLVRSIDRIMIIGFLGQIQLGYYSIATMMFAGIYQLPTLIYSVIFPRFYEAFGRSDLKGVRLHFEKPILIFAHLFPIVIGATILILPFFVHYLLPDYQPGVAPANILLLGVFFISLINMPMYLLTALDKQHYIVIIGLIATFVIFTADYIFLKMGLGLTGVALGTCLGYFFYCTAIIACSCRNYTKTVFELFLFFKKIYLPFVWILLGVWFASFIFKDDFSHGFTKGLFFVFVKEVLFLVICLPLCYFLNKETLFITEIISHINTHPRLLKWRRGKNAA